MDFMPKPETRYLRIEAALVAALTEVDRLGLMMTGARLQHALDTLRHEWADGGDADLEPDGGDGPSA
jgi:hypothetical protein